MDDRIFYRGQLVTFARRLRDKYQWIMPGGFQVVSHKAGDPYGPFYNNREMRRNKRPVVLPLSKRDIVAIYKSRKQALEDSRG